jgi:hypothetical protein
VSEYPSLYGDKAIDLNGYFDNRIGPYSPSVPSRSTPLKCAFQAQCENRTSFKERLEINSNSLSTIIIRACRSNAVIRGPAAEATCMDQDDDADVEFKDMLDRFYGKVV